MVRSITSFAQVTETNIVSSSSQSFGCHKWYQVIISAYCTCMGGMGGHCSLLKPTQSKTSNVINIGYLAIINLFQLWRFLPLISQPQRLKWKQLPYIMKEQLQVRLLLLSQKSKCCPHEQRKRLNFILDCLKLKVIQLYYIITKQNLVTGMSLLIRLQGFKATYWALQLRCN